jgi:class 3 adenylate cyclase/tetratricopeptide (TPR) repeat protein
LPGKRFCAECGSPLPIHCPKCGAETPANAKFCADCGTALAAIARPGPDSPAIVPSTAKRIRITPEQGDPTPAIDGERKTVTALFADIKGSMELMEGLDPEEARAIVDPALKLIIDAIDRYGGYVVQSTGDGIFALFGAPVANEDHPQRALYAALRLQEGIRRYSGKLIADGGTPLEARVGINTGEVVVRTLTSAAGRTEYTPIGHTANLAARMQVIAPSGSIAITEHTRRLVEGYFQLKPRGPTRVKGLSEPVEVYEVTGLGPLRTRLQRAEARGLTKFVGRQREMDALKHAAEQARGGQGQIVAVMADPGVGKSRLFYEFKATSQSGWMVLEALSVSYGKASAYLPVLELLSQYFEISRDDDGRKQREHILGKVLGLDRNLEDALPYFYSLHGIAEAGDSLAQMDPQVRRRRTLEAIKRIVLRESLNQPLMLIFEDVHWIDSETQTLLNLLVDAIANAPILLLVNYRPEYRHDWSSRTHYTQLRLGPLARESADEMLSALMGDDQDLVSLKRLIIERTEGTPFFMEEIVQALFADGVLQRNGMVKLAKPMSTVKVPATVQAVLASRIDRLAPAEKELLQTLAVLGREFTLTLVQRVMPRPSDELEQMLSHLQLSEFINEQPTVGEIEYCFKHALTQEVAYNSVLIERRKALHEEAGEAIERLFAERLEDCVTDLARHFDRSGNLRKAVEYLRRAAQRALEQVAHAEVIGYVTRALELIKNLPRGVDRDRHELELQMILGSSLYAAVGPGSSERERALTRALELCEKLGDSRLMEVMLSLALVQWSRREPLSSLRLCEQALAVAEQAKNADMLAAAHSGIGLPLLSLGQFQKAREHLERSVELSAGLAVGAFGQVLVATSQAPFVLAQTLFILGYPTTALRVSKEAFDKRQHSGPYISAGALNMYILVHVALRNVSAVAKQVDQLAVIAAEREIPIFQAIAIFYRACLTVDAGRVKEGLGEMARSITRLGAYPGVDFVMLARAEVCARKGLPDEGLAAVDEALIRCEKTAQFKAEFHRLKGELTLLGDPRSEAVAERYLRQAIEIAQRQAARVFELRATTSLARLVAKEGRREEARVMIGEIYGSFTEGFDTADLKEAKALLEELSV